MTDENHNDNDDDDDLDAFFDEVLEVEANVVVGGATDSTTTGISSNTEPATFLSDNSQIQQHEEQLSDKKRKRTDEDSNTNHNSNDTCNVAKAQSIAETATPVAAVTGPPPRPTKGFVVVAAASVQTAATITTNDLYNIDSAATTNIYSVTGSTMMSHAVPTTTTTYPQQIGQQQQQQQQYNQQQSSFGPIYPNYNNNTNNNLYPGQFGSQQQPSYPPTAPNTNQNTGYGVHSVQVPTFTTTTTTTDPSTTNLSTSNNASTNKKGIVRTAAGKVWVDESLADWPDNDFRIFVGNLDPAVSDQLFYQHFTSRYTSVARTKIVRDAHSAKAKQYKYQQTQQQQQQQQFDAEQGGISKGYGFVSFTNALECAKAIREVDQTWIGSRPVRVKRSHWKDRDLKERKEKDTKLQNQRKKFGI